MVNTKIWLKRAEVLRDKAFKIAGNPSYNGYKKGVTSMAYRFYDKNLQVAVL